MTDQNINLDNQTTDVIPERKVWYIDVGNLSPTEAQAIIEKFKKEFKGE
jgi:hypothetical protein